MPSITRQDTIKSSSLGRIAVTTDPARILDKYFYFFMSLLIPVIDSGLPVLSRAATQHGLIPLEIIERRIYFIRTHKVMLDSDLAELYGVTTKRLNEQVKRNIDRFSADFMFRLNQ
jgi:hypothetical protein